MATPLPSFSSLLSISQRYPRLDELHLSPSSTVESGSGLSSVEHVPEGSRLPDQCRRAAAMPSDQAAGSPVEMRSMGTEPQLPVRRRIRKYTNPQASNHCHICQRSSKAVPVAVCANIRRGVCRKIVCELCFEMFDLDITKFSTAPDQSQWVCTHCTMSCPSRAQCWTYRKTNSRRREKRRLLNEAASERSAGEPSITTPEQE